MNHTIRFLVLGLLLPLSFLAAAETANAQSEPLRALVAEALKNNPDLQAARARWRMYEHRILPAESLEDPQLSLSFLNYPVDSLAADETPMTGSEVRIAQKFPFPGKLGARGEMAEQRSNWYRGVYQDARLQLVQKIKDAWYRLYFQDRAIEITEKNLTILDDFIRLTETRYEVGEGLQQDVLKAQVERSKLMDRLFTLKQQRESIQADMNRLLDRPSGTRVSPPAKIELAQVETTAETLKEDSERNRPLYAAYASLVERYRAQRELAKLDYFPDVNVWMGYRFRAESRGDPVDGTDFIGGGVSINLPIWQRKRAEAVAEADSGIRMALRRYDEFRNQVHFTVHDAYVEMERQKKLVELYRTGVIPQSEQAYRSAMAAYRVGEVDFLSLLDSLMKLYDYQMEYFRVRAAYQRSVARLEAGSGVDLTGIPGAAPATEQAGNSGGRK